MFKHYKGLWLLLTLSLIIIVIISFSEQISIGKYQLKKSTISQNLLANSDSPDILGDTISETEYIATKELKTDSLPQSIFIFGDSMTYNLALRMAQYAKQNGHTIHSVNWDSSNTKIWAEYDTLANCIQRYKPTQIFISLGSNELYYKNPESRIPYVKKILEVIDTIPYVWIGPPNWDKDNGMNDLLAKTCKPGSFFRSEGMEFERKKDKIHPTRKASALWVDSIMKWIPKSSHPFLAETPDDSIGKANPNIVFLKALNK